MKELELVFRFGSLEIRRSVPLRNSPGELLQRAQLKGVPDPKAEVSHCLVNDIFEEMSRTLLSGVMQELVCKLDT